MFPKCIIEGNAKFHLEISENKHVIFFPTKVIDSHILSQVKDTKTGWFLGNKLSKTSKISQKILINLHFFKI